MSDTNDGATVLVVDDEQPVADTYTLRLEMEYNTRAAYGGEAALEAVDADVDVVLLDRRMPDISGDEVLQTIRDLGLDCRVIMATAVEPDFDIVDMPFDDYLSKPIEQDELQNAIEKQLGAEEYDDRLSEYMEITRKIQLLKAEKGTGTVADNDEVQELKARADELREELDMTVDEFDDSKQAFDDLV